MTKYRRSSAMPESKSGRMCGCWRFAVVWISARKRSPPMTAASSGLRTLSATRRSCLTSCQQHDRAAAVRQLPLHVVAAAKSNHQIGDDRAPRQLAYRVLWRVGRRNFC
jgi:hypothetical protein